jgi:hypothetical protein
MLQCGAVRTVSCNQDALYGELAALERSGGSPHFTIFCSHIWPQQSYSFLCKHTILRGPTWDGLHCTFDGSCQQRLGVKQHSPIKPRIEARYINTNQRAVSNLKLKSKFNVIGAQAGWDGSRLLVSSSLFSLTYRQSQLN